MSKLTAAQVIGLGEYLNPDFDSTSLTVSQLLGVLGFHNVRYPTPYTKSKLVGLFNDEIKPKSAKFKKERLKKETSQASDEGIMDGVTGLPVGGQRATARRSSRRISQAQMEPDSSPDPPKRRRSSAQPILSGASGKSKSAFARYSLVEESEPEDQELPSRKVGRSKKTSEAAGSEARRVSLGQEDSGWEDNNIFQSGAESSSPARPSPIRRKTSRKSFVPRKSRKSMSVPPPSSSNSSPQRPGDGRDFGEHLLNTKFEPFLPTNLSITRGAPPVPKSKRSIFKPIDHDSKDEDDELNMLDRDSDFREYDASNDRATGEVGVAAEAESDSEEVDEDKSIAVLHGKGSRSSFSPEPKPMSLLLRLLITLVVLATIAGVINYKRESTRIGYCDTGTNTNKALETMKKERDAMAACDRENRTFLYPPTVLGQMDKTPCPPPALIPLPYPTGCTPCPEHGSCTQNTVTCDVGYLLRPHPALFLLTPTPSTAYTMRFSLSLSPSELVWKIVSMADGLPTLGPVAFPPRCVEDPRRKKHIGSLGKAVEIFLSRERGRKLCANAMGVQVKDSEGGEAMKWGMELEKLKETMKMKASARLLPTFDDTFNEAIQQLIQWGGVTLGEDTKGKRYLAHKTPDLTWNCAVIVKSREIWIQWRVTVLSIIAAIVCLHVAKVRRSHLATESKRVGELVQIALDTLRNQELAHYTDPVTAPHAYLSSLQLRDLILQDEPSISIRRRLWDQVEMVVEGNVNVRVNLEEVRGGDEMRVWRWLGGSGLRKRVQFEER